jgi:hypothetical protein
VAPRKRIVLGFRVGVDMVGWCELR